MHLPSDKKSPSYSDLEAEYYYNTKEIDPDKREWEYSPEGIKIYKPEAGKPTPTRYEK